MIPRRRVGLDADIAEMARRSYGYGQWVAPYWFIGPEQALGRHERADAAASLSRRAAVWRELGRHELNDCRTFHCLIEERRWHCERPRVQLQSTWRPLILLLMAYLGKLDNLADSQQQAATQTREMLRDYQRDRWGTLDGETCVIELSGLAAANMDEASDTAAFLPRRKEFIRKKIQEHQPKLVLMYQLGSRPGYEQIVERTFPPEPEPFFRKGTTLMALTPHPVSRIQVNGRSLGNQYWIELGTRLRANRCIPS